MVCLVDEPIKYPLGQHGIGEKGIPVLGRAVAGEHHGAYVAALIDQLIEILPCKMCYNPDRYMEVESSRS